MPTADQRRLEADRASPRILQLWWALRPLTSVIRFMQTGAHPDDEMSGMLAALALRDGLNLSYACSTRGEGGQNDIGTQTGADLGALRTREMERACDVLNMRMYWLSDSAEDPITDFGFSKSGSETLSRWGRDRTLARFVEIVRTERPDILCPTFLDVPGQHGHHRAMTQAAHHVIAAASDPGFPSNLPPRQVGKLYLPATSGAGQAYDDAEPPPPATLRIDGSGADPISGWSWNRIGQQSRAYHRTQGMGRWVPPGSGADWLLHLAESHVSGPDTALSSGLPATLGALAEADGAGAIAADLTAAQIGIDAAIAAFPDNRGVADGALEALEAVRRAAAGCPDALADRIAHRLAAKEVQLGHVLRLALGVEARAWVDEVFLPPGHWTDLTAELDSGLADSEDLTFDVPPGWDVTDGVLSLTDDASPSDPYRAVYDPAAPDAPALCLSLAAAGTSWEVRLPFETPPVILPPRSAALTPEAAVLNLQAATRRVSFELGSLRPPGARPMLAAPEGWEVTLDALSGTAQAPEGAVHGINTMALQLDGHPAETVRRIDYDHIAPTARSHPAELRVLVIDAAVPKGRVGYIGAGNDRVDHWLAALGADVTALSDGDLANEAALAGYGAIVVGIFAMRFRAGLAEAMPRLHRWIEAGGTLVTLYHRPWDNWDPDVIPPKRLEIGQPSLRWRVTDESAPVRVLSDHPLLTTPNVIGPTDWDGWVKERGLYFAKSWDAAYTPLLEMADPGEAPHRGSLLVADIGAGRHVHTSLILHHQMEHLVPGAFRLMANLIARR
ncbi:MAG: PIG-L family deacetylase [Pseudomonadota bacterium]